MKYNYINICSILGIISLLFSCVDITAKKTTIEIEDNERHYYPVLAGQQKDISFKIKNTGKNPLIVTDIITSCGCLNTKQGLGGTFTVPPNKERILTLSYNSAKNIGYVKHYITLYGNFEDTEFKELIFDINVVPNAMYTKDYEELYSDKIDKEGGFKKFVDGDESNKGYYMDEDFGKSVSNNH